MESCRKGANIYKWIDSFYAKFSDKALQGTGTYYLTLDAFAGKVNGQNIVNINK